MRIRLLAVLGAAILVAGAPRPQQEDDGVWIDEIKKEILERIGKCIDAKDWKGAFDLYDLALAKYRTKLVRPDPAVARWCGVTEHLNRLFGKLPAEAIEYYRREHDGKASDAYDRACKEGDPRERDRQLEGIVDGFFFARVTAEVLDGLAGRALEDRRPQDAVHFWRKLLEQYPDPEVPRQVIAARVAAAAQSWQNESALANLKEYVQKNGIDGPISAGGRQTTLAEFLSTLSVNSAAAERSSGKLPVVPEGMGLFDRKAVCVRNEVKRWTYDIANQAQVQGRRMRMVPQQGQPAQEFPFLPAHTRIDGKDYVILTSGERVVVIDPSRADSENPDGCIRWKFPENNPIKRAPNPNGWAYSSPFIGATVSDGTIYATLYSEVKVPEGGPQNQDAFQGTCRLVALDLRGRVLWDTDDSQIHPLFRNKECGDFYDRNWSLSGPPLIKGERLYVGVCTSPMSEPESRLLCLDRRTGEPLWCVFLGSARNAMMNGWWGGGLLITYLTLLAEDSGVIYAQTSVGVVAAVHGVSGNIIWLSKYQRDVKFDPQNWRGEGSKEIRPPNPPLVHRGRLYVLPQDHKEWQVFDLSSGELLQPGPVKGSDDNNSAINWENIRQLLGTVDDWMIVGGSESYMVNLGSSPPRAFSLTSSNVSRCGRGVVAGETIYLPTFVSEKGPNGALTIYHGKVGAWRYLDPSPWQEAGEYGNLLVAGDYLIVAAQNRFTVYTDEATTDREFVVRLSQSPPSPEAFLQHGDIMMKNDRLKRASESYLAFVRAAEGDPRFERTVIDKKKELYGIFMRRGADSAAKEDPKAKEEAAEHFAAARDFAYDDGTLGEATRCLAETYEKLAVSKNDKGFAKKAVEEFQKMVEKSGETLHKPDKSDLIRNMLSYATERIGELRKTFGDEVYAPIEQAARESLEQVRGSVDALRRIVELYPESKAAVEAFKRMLSEFAKQGRWEKVISTLREMKEKYPNEFKIDLQKRINEALEKLLDWKRLSAELERTGDLFANEKIDGVAVKDYVALRLEEIGGRAAESAPPLPDSLKVIAELDGMKAAGNVFQQMVGYSLLEPIGPTPPALGGDVEFFARGSSIELWNVRERRMIWSAPHPGGYLGGVYQEAPEGGVMVRAVLAGSPAEKAGIRPGDILQVMDSRAVRVETFDRMLAGAGEKIRLTASRDGRQREVEVALAQWPQEMRPGIIGAAFTREYQIAVVWPDAVAAFDAATGRPAWSFHTVRDKFVLDEIGAVDGRLLLHEHLHPDRFRSALRMAAAQRPPVEDAYSRLICIDDVTGSVQWARELAFDSGGPQSHSVQISGDYFGGDFAILNWNQPDGELLVVSADGRQRRRVSLGKGVLGCTDDGRGGLIWIDGNRVLHGVKMWGDADKAAIFPDVNLMPKYMDPETTVCGLRASGDWIAVVLPGSVPDRQSRVRFRRGPAVEQVQPPRKGGRIAVFRSGKEHVVVELPAVRMLAMGSRPTASIGGDGVLYVYNVPDSEQSPPAKERRSYLTAWRLNDAGGCEMLWDAVAPCLPPSGSTAKIIPVDGTVFFYAFQASLPGDGGEKVIGMMYSRAEGGYLKAAITDLQAFEDTFGQGRPIIVRRGRVFIQTARGLKIYGG